jgi:hypothetical protein
MAVDAAAHAVAAEKAVPAADPDHPDVAEIAGADRDRFALLGVFSIA